MPEAAIRSTALLIVLTIASFLPKGSSALGTGPPVGAPRLLALYHRGATGTVQRPAAASLRGLSSAGQLGEAIEAFVVTDGQPLESKLKQLAADPAVAVAEPDVLKQRTSVDAPSQRLSISPNDFGASKQWALNAIGAYAAWDIVTEAPNITVCIVDSGIDYQHPDLAPNMSPLRGNDFSDDFDVVAGKPDEPQHTWEDTDPMDTAGHGTHVAGIIGAVSNNSQGIAGIAWKVQLLACKIFDESGFGSMSALLNCYIYCRLCKAHIMTASFAGKDYSRIEMEELKRSGDAGQLVVVAAGNNRKNLDRERLYPASYNLPNIITVTASGRKDRLSSFADWGRRSVHLTAPGEGILSTWLQGSYRMRSGTSQAAPHVAGAAALVWAAAGPGATAEQVKGLLLSTVDQVPALATRTVSGGRLNLARAVAAARGLCYTPARRGMTRGGIAVCRRKPIRPRGVGGNKTTMATTSGSGSRRLLAA